MMTRKILLLLLIVGFGAVAASAAPLCLNGSYQSYIALGAGGCQWGNAVFSNFSYGYTSSDGTTAASPGKNAGSVAVTPEFQPVADNNHPGLAFGTANLTPAPGFFEDYTFTFTVTALPGFLLEDAFLKITGAFFIGQGSGTVVETLTPSNAPQTSLIGFFTDTDTTHKTSSVVYNGSNSVTVTKDIKLTNLNSPLFDMSSVSNDFSLTGGSTLTPEPGTMILFGSGLIIAAMNLKRLSRKS